MCISYNVAVLGATGAVGELMISLLEQRNFPVDTLYPLASSRSVGKTVKFRGETIPVQDVAEFDWTRAQIGLFTAGPVVSCQWLPVAVNAGCVAIDNTQAFRMNSDIPLVVPEVNQNEIGRYHDNGGIISSPHCPVIQMSVALKPIYDAVGITRVNVCTYQAVSDNGKQAIDELMTQTTDILNGKPIHREVFPKQIAFNVLPEIDIFFDNGYTKEEMRMVWETRKVLNDYAIQINVTAVRVPVLYGHSKAIHLETREKITADQARDLLSAAPGIQVIDTRKPGGYPTAATDVAGHDPVFVGRIREDISHPLGLNLWVVSDNIRKGAALNCVQIAEVLIEKWYW